MANIITKSDVFDFMGTASDVQDVYADAMDSIILKKQQELEDILGRKVTPTTGTDILFQHNLNCEIYNNKLYLKGAYRDTYTISSIKENNVTLSAVTDYGGTDDYYLDTSQGILIRNDANWSTEQFAIKATLIYGIGGETESNAIKQILTEMCAAVSGLWTQNVSTEGGDITTIRNNIRRDTEKTMERYILNDF